MKLLHVDSSVLGEASVSRRLSAAAVAKFKDAHPALDIIRRDLVAAPLGHMTPAFVAATRGPGAGAPPPADVLPDLAVLDEFLAADIVVIGAPMYNFGIASNLKAWLDRLAVPGRTFRYDADGPHGLCGDKRVVVASSRGGIYSEGPWAPADHQEPHLRTLLGFIGITDLTFIRAEGVAMGEEGRAKAIAAGESALGALAA